MRFVVKLKHGEYALTEKTMWISQKTTSVKENKDGIDF